MTMWREDPVFGYMPSIPIPFWVRHWLFWSRPGCYQCRIKFKNIGDYERHYVLTHFGERPDSPEVESDNG